MLQKLKSASPYIVVVLILLGIHSLTSSVKPENTPYDFKQSSVKVSGGSGHGSGVVVDTNASESLIITNKHVCKGVVQDPKVVMAIQENTFYYNITRDKKFLKILADLRKKIVDAVGKTVTIKHGLTKREYTGTILALDSVQDICLVKVPQGNMSVAKIYNKELKPGLKIITHGHPLDLENHVTDGYIGDPYTIGPEYFVHTTATILPGNSGSGAFTMDGQLVGLNTRAAGSMPTVNLIVPWDSIILFMDGQWLGK